MKQKENKMSKKKIDELDHNESKSQKYLYVKLIESVSRTIGQFLKDNDLEEEGEVYESLALTAALAISIMSHNNCPSCRRKRAKDTYEGIMSFPGFSDPEDEDDDESEDCED